jgi:hypothetical protein
MFVIKDSQLEALLKSFYKDSEDYLRKKFPVSTGNISAAVFKTIIDDGIEKATGYNIVERTDTRIFLEFIVALGADFDTSPRYGWAADILEISNLPGAEKIKRMLRAYSLTPET